MSEAVASGHSVRVETSNLVRGLEFGLYKRLRLGSHTGNIYLFIYLFKLRKHFARVHDTVRVKQVLNLSHQLNAHLVL